MNTATYCRHTLPRFCAPIPRITPHQRHGQKRLLTSHTASFVRSPPRPYRLPSNTGTPLRYGQTRSISIRTTGSIKENIKILWRYHPYHVIGISTILITGVSILVGLNYYHAHYFSKQFHKYPEPVAKQMRKAWYYTEIEFSPQQAIRYYAKAIDAARELRMDPWSNEVIGIKESLIYCREKTGDLPYAAKLWETLRADTIAQSEAALSLTELDASERQHRRTRLLKRSVQISVKLAEIYSDPTMHNDTSALELLMWSVTTVLRETAARSAANATPESHGPWLSNDEFGASMEALGHKYEAANAHFLAAPLFLQALASKETTDCHSVVLMNNLASSLAQQDPPRDRGMPPPDRAQLVRAGREWAEKALSVAAQIEPPLRNEECDQGCATALYNLGEMAEMLDEQSEAARKYKEASSLARAIGFHDGQRAAGDALRRLGKND